MEDTLGVVSELLKNGAKLVLILVLMEDTLGVYRDVKGCGKVSLNPCFNGRYSRSLVSTSLLKDMLQTS